MSPSENVSFPRNKSKWTKCRGRGIFEFEHQKFCLERLVGNPEASDELRLRSFCAADAVFPYQINVILWAMDRTRTLQGVSDLDLRRVFPVTLRKIIGTEI
jgi:hypothetical protein